MPVAGADSTLLADIIHKLDERGEDSAHHDEDTEDGSSVLHVHMYPAESPICAGVSHRDEPFKSS